MIGYGGIALALGSAIKGLFPALDIRLVAVCATALVPILLYTGSYAFFERTVVGDVRGIGRRRRLYVVPRAAPGRSNRPGNGTDDSRRFPVDDHGTDGLGGRRHDDASVFVLDQGKDRRREDRIGVSRVDFHDGGWIASRPTQLILAISFAFLAMGVATLHAQGNRAGKAGNDVAAILHARHVSRRPGDIPRRRVLLDVQHHRQLHGRQEPRHRVDSGRRLAAVRQHDPGLSHCHGRLSCRHGRDDPAGRKPAGRSHQSGGRHERRGLRVAGVRTCSISTESCRRTRGVIRSRGACCAWEAWRFWACR